MKTFLTEDQITTLKAKKWQVIPKCANITLYKDEFDEDAWNSYCNILGVDSNKDELVILAVGTI